MEFAERLGTLGIVFNPVVAALCLAVVAILAVIQSKISHQELATALIRILNNYLIIIIVLCAAITVDNVAIFLGVYFLAFGVIGVLIGAPLLGLGNLAAIIFILWRLAEIVRIVFQMLVNSAPENSGPKAVSASTKARYKKDGRHLMGVIAGAFETGVIGFLLFVPFVIAFTQPVWVWNKERAELTRQLGSQANEEAVRASKELRKNGWLNDGSLKGLNLRDANLAGADLRYARIEGADWTHANLEDANLADAFPTNERRSCGAVPA